MCKRIVRQTRPVCSLPSSGSYLSQEYGDPPFAFSAHPLAIPFYLLAYIFIFV